MISDNTKKYAFPLTKLSGIRKYDNCKEIGGIRDKDRSLVGITGINMKRNINIDFGAGMIEAYNTFISKHRIGTD